jgi:hypothetical protein
MTSLHLGFGRIVLSLVVGFAPILAAASCSSQSDVGTNTNWVSCKNDADCVRAGLAVCSGGFCKNSASAVPTCNWPSSLDGDASSRSACHAGRALVQCELEGGITEMCVSEAPTRCPDSSSPPSGCQDRCQLDEYVAECGGVGPGPIPDPPPGCRSLGAVPAGIVYYCCSCAS